MTRHQKSTVMSDMTHLEAASVGPLVATDYPRKLESMKEVLHAPLDVVASVPATAGTEITRVFNTMYAEGHQADWEEKALAAFVWKLPQ